jgi:hypothetical protein
MSLEALVDHPVSVIISVCSFIVACLAYRQAGKANAQVEWHNQMSSKKILDAAREKYVQEMIEVEKEFYQHVETLRAVSGKSRLELGYLLDNFESYFIPYCKLSHEFYKATEYIRDVYDSMLTYQSGRNLIFRIRVLKDIDRNSVNEEENNQLKVVDFFRRKKGSERTLEQKLLTSKFLQSVLVTIYERIPASSEAELFRSGYKFIEEYLEVHEKIQEPLLNLSKRLKRMLYRNSFEAIKLEEMGDLSHRYERVIGDIDRIRHLTFFDLRGLNDIPTHEAVGKLLYVGSVMRMVDDFEEWGKSNSYWGTLT